MGEARPARFLRRVSLGSSPQRNQKRKSRGAGFPSEILGSGSFRDDPGGEISTRIEIYEDLPSECLDGLFADLTRPGGAEFE
jgi:hypothetical protein